MVFYPKYEVQHVFKTLLIYFNLVFAFFLGKIVIWGQLLVTPVIYTCFSYSNCKIYNAGAVVPTTS